MDKGFRGGNYVYCGGQCVRGVVYVKMALVKGEKHFFGGGRRNCQNNRRIMPSVTFSFRSGEMVQQQQRVHIFTHEFSLCRSEKVNVASAKQFSRAPVKRVHEESLRKIFYPLQRRPFSGLFALLAPLALIKAGAEFQMTICKSRLHRSH